MPLEVALVRRLASAPMGLGGAPLGNLFRAVAEADALDVVRHARDRGIVHFDTAPHYGQGLSERRFGEALRGAPRGDVVLSTKVGRLLTHDAHAPRDRAGYVDVAPCTTHYDYSSGGVLRSLEDSRKRLGIQRIDIAFVHDV